MVSLTLQPERIAFLGDYLPRLCGIATFTHDLCEAVSDVAAGSDCFVGAVNDLAEGYDYPPACALRSWKRILSPIVVLLTF